MIRPNLARSRATMLWPLLTALLLCAAAAAFGQTSSSASLDASVGGAPPAKIDTGDTAWMLVSCALVLLMTPGLALFYGGMVRSKNVLNTLMQSFVAMAIITVSWVVVGYSIAFAKGGPFIGSPLAFLGLNGVGQTPNADYAATIPHQVYMLFQMMFAIITPALISGAIADRMKFSTYCVFITLWGLLVYAPLAHMVWGADGLLSVLNANGLYALDFAGGTVVHISSGISALVLCIMLGRRTDTHEDMRPHNLPMTLIGTALLWFGWFGFNAGSATASNGLAGSAFMTTHIAAAVAGLVWVLIEWAKYKKPTALGLATGAVAGLVAITPASGFVGPMAAILIGAGVAFISFFAIKLKERFGYDDALDVFGVHGVGGTWGALATGLFASSAVNSVAKYNGLLTGGGIAQLWRQMAAVGIAIAYAAIVTAVLAAVLKATMGLRVLGDEETAGLDLALLGESAYSGPDASLVSSHAGAMEG